MMDLQRLRYLKASVQAIKLNLEPLILSSPRGIYPITRHRELTRNYSLGNDQQLTPANDNGKDLLVMDWKFQQNTIKKRKKHTTASHKFIDAIGFQNGHSLQGSGNSINNDFTSKKMPYTIVDSRQFLTIHKSILLVRHYSKLVPKVERWRAKDKKDRRQLAKLVECVPGKNSDCGGGFFKNIFCKLFGGKCSTDQKCKPCRKQHGSSKQTEGKQEKKVEKPVDDCDVPVTNVKKADKSEKLPKINSKPKDDCDDKVDQQSESKKVSKTEEKCASRGNLKRSDDRNCAKSSKTVNRTDSSASICQQTPNRIESSNSCSSGTSSDRLKQLDTLEKCIGTLQQLIRNLKLEEEMKGAANNKVCKPICPKPEEVVCSNSKKPVCPEPSKPVCPEIGKPTCPKPITPTCPEPEKPICPVPVKPLCPEPLKKPACPQPKRPVCPEPKKPVCPPPKKPVCPELKKKPACPEKPICSQSESSDGGDGEKPYKCGIIEDINPPKKRQQNLRDKNDKYSACGKSFNDDAKHRDEQCPQKLKNCTNDDESNNNNNC